MERLSELRQIISINQLLSTTYNSIMKQQPPILLKLSFLVLKAVSEAHKKIDQKQTSLHLQQGRSELEQKEVLCWFGFFFCLCVCFNRGGLEKSWERCKKKNGRKHLNLSI